MTKKPRPNLLSDATRRFTLVFVAAIALFTCRIAMRVHRARLNHQLIQALYKNDEYAAITALRNGADPNATDTGFIPPSSMIGWIREVGFGAQRRDKEYHAPALIVAMDYRWRTAKQVGCFRTDYYIPANDPPEMASATKALLDTGANFRIHNEVGYTPLQIAAWQGKARTVELLLARGANLNEVGAGKQFQTESPLHLAIHGESAESVKALLAHGARLNAKWEFYGIPLHKFIRHSNPELRHIVLNALANPNR